MTPHAVRLLARAAFMVVALPSALEAKPAATSLFCREYPQAPVCSTSEASCTTCHAAVPARNAYGTSIEEALLQGSPRPLSDASFAGGLPSALAAAGQRDADGDGVSSLQEIQAGTNPADATSKPASGECRVEQNSSLNLCAYDAAYAYSRVLLDFCGRSASVQERATFRQSPDAKAALHAALGACLQSPYWRGRDGVVWKLGAAKIRPNASLKAGPNPGSVTLANYDDDFALFVYAHLDDHDVRDVLTADYYVDPPTPANPTMYTQVRLTPQQDLARRPGFTTYQALEQSQRAGMLTTRWFRAINTMFSAIPRTTAAQAYRAYLGLDIALQQGLQDPVPASEPVDHDAKGVRAEGCIGCHRTLDPLSYPFSRYEGLDVDPNIRRLIEMAMMMLGQDGGVPMGPLPQLPVLPQYIPNRMERFVSSEGAGIVNVPEAGLLFGRPVANVVEWGKSAANSPAFAQKVVLDYWRLLFAEEPRPADLPELARLAAALAGPDVYRVERMLHRLIDTEAYGAP
jgi:hypothetical protein